MKKLSEWSDNELSNLFKNSTYIITKNKPQKSEAIKKIEIFKGNLKDSDISFITKD